MEKKTERNVWRDKREKLINNRIRKKYIFLETFGRQSEEMVHKVKK